MFYQGKNVLVAGGAGLVGQSLVRKLLDQGACVRATQFKSRKITAAHKNLEVVSCDLRNEPEAAKVFKDMDIVFIAAGVVGGTRKIKEDPSYLIFGNLELRSKLIALAAKSGAERCAHVSSSYVYPHTGRPNVENEGFQGDPPAPVNYGLGWVERYLETLCKHFHMTTKTQYAIARPTNMYGPHDNFNLEECHVIPALVVKAVNRMNPFEAWGNGEDVRPFTYVDDFTDGLMRMTEKYAVAEPLNLCSREIPTVKEVLKTLFDYLEFHPRLVFSSDQPSLFPYKVSDPSLARELLGWEAQVSLKEGLRRTVDWYVENFKRPGRTAPEKTAVS